MESLTVPLEVLSPNSNRSVTIEALVDTRVCFTCLPSSLLNDLGIVPHRQIQSILPDGSVVDDVIGEAWVKVDGVETHTIVLFNDDSAPARLGHHTLTGALLEFDPVNRRLVPVRASRPTRLLIG